MKYKFELAVQAHSKSVLDAKQQRLVMASTIRAKIPMPHSEFNARTENSLDIRLFPDSDKPTGFIIRAETEEEIRDAEVKLSRKVFPDQDTISVPHTKEIA